MKFYIVTPTFQSGKWLLPMLRSVADQVDTGIEIHHHVQDGGSRDSTKDLLHTWHRQTALPGYTFTFDSSPDKGMYDALNKAWSHIPEDADITAHLNADEQYLPGALAAVATLFRAHTTADVVECSYMVNDSNWGYVCHRRAVRPTRWISARVCQLCTCATFHRVSSFMAHGIRFDDRFRVYGDVLFFRRLTEQGVQVHAAPGTFTSAFTMTGCNLAWQETNREELRHLNSITPRLAMKLAPIGGRITGLSRILLDCILPSPTFLSLYHGKNAERTCSPIERATCRWRQHT